MTIRARHMQKIQPFRVMALLAEAKKLEAEGRSIVHLEVGEPDFTTPEPIIEAGIEALKKGKTHYTPSAGEPALREAISQYYQDSFNVNVSASRILITPGASGALQLALNVLINPDDKVIMADPGYPCNRNFVYLLGGKVQAVNVDADTGFQITVESLKNCWSDDARVLILATPSNPTGTLIDRKEMKFILEFVEERNGVVVVDEIYQGLTYSGSGFTALEMSDKIFVVNSFSKYFGMTGWRVGWIVVPDDYVSDVDKLAQNLYLAAPTPSQEAALSAFKPETMDILKSRRQEYQLRRDYLIPELKRLGFIIDVIPEGAFYIYANCSALTDDSLQFCKDVLHEAGVAITPGLDFGSNHPEQYVRFSYTASIEKLQLAVSRLAEFISGINS